MCLYFSFLMKLHPCHLPLLIYFPLTSSVLGSYFSFFKKSSLPYRIFLFVFLRNHQILEQVETIILWKINLRAHRGDFSAFSRAIRNGWEKPCFSHVVKYTIWWKKSSHTLDKKWVPVSQALPIRWIWLHFPMLR